MANDPPDLLARICARTLDEIERRSVGHTVREMRGRALDRAAPRGFARALSQRRTAGQTGLIAEIKRASPSAGLIRPDFDPAAIARAYQRAGAACLSVLTEGAFFQGDLVHLEAARQATSLPVLRKDFMLRDWQIYESRAHDADCVLLILAILDDEQASDLLALAVSIGLDVLVEVHDEAELHRALALPEPVLSGSIGIGQVIIGINNRNLRTLATTLDTTLRLAPMVPGGRIVVAESGIASRGDVRRLADAGASCLLVGESLLRQPDPGAAAASLIGTQVDSASPPC